MCRSLCGTVPPPRGTARGSAMFVDDKVVMIVGAGPGLGATLARRCAEDGADLVLAARTAATLERIADETRARRCAGARGADRRVGARPGQSLVEQAVAEFGRIDVLVNAAFPPAPGGPVVDMDDDAMDVWRRSIDAGAYGTLLTCRFVAPHMIDAGRGRDRQRDVDDQPHGPRRPQRLRRGQGGHAPVGLGARRRARTPRHPRQRGRTRRHPRRGRARLDRGQCGARTA